MATKYQGPSERAAWTVAEIWNERRRRGLEQQARVRAKQRRTARVSFRPKNYNGTLARSDERGSLPESSDRRGYADPERVVQGPIIPGIGPPKGSNVVTALPDPDLRDGAAARDPVAWHRPPATPELFAAFAKAQASFGALRFNARNDHFNNPYATLDAMLAAVKPGLNANGLAFVQHVRYEGRDVTVTSELWHASGQVYCFEPLTGQTQQQQPTPQQQAAAATYLKRQALSANLGIAGELDDDGNAASDPPPTAERGTDPPRSSARKVAKSSQPAPAPAAGNSSSGERGAEGVERAIGTIDDIADGTSKKGKPFWKVRLAFDDDRPPLTVFVWDGEVGKYVSAGQRSEITYEPGEYPKALSWCHLREDGKSYIPGYGEVPF